MGQENAVVLDQEEVTSATASPGEALDQDDLFALIDADNDFLVSEDSAALIQAHNDKLNGRVEPTLSDSGDVADEDLKADPPLGDEGGLESDIEHGEEADADEASEQLIEMALGAGTEDQPKPFDGFSNARDFMANGASLSGLVGKLSKPAAKVEANSGTPSATQASGANAAPSQAPEDQQQGGPQPEDRVQMSLGRAALLTGAIGLSKLTKVVASGGNIIGDKLHDWQIGSAENKVNQSINSLQSRFADLRGKGLSGLDNPSLSLLDRQEMARQFFAQPENKGALGEMADLINKMGRDARTVIERSMSKGETADDAANRALSPLRRFTEENEKLLESLKDGNETLLEKMDNVMNSLFEMLKQLFTRLAQSMGVGSKPSSGPSMG